VIRNAARIGGFPTPNAIGRARLAAFAPSPGNFLIVTGARLSADKGINVLIEAAHRVVEQHPGARFIVFGAGPEKHHLEQLIQMNDLGHAFALAGFNDSLDQLLPNADIMALPSLTEGLPNIVLEASAAGVPVVATAVGGTPEAVVDGETGLLVAAEDPVALADAINKLLADPARRERMGRAGREFVRTEFSFAKQAQQYLELLARMGLRQPVWPRSLAA
jgi:glycosyltransferase involved in cell wall biosynthesis